jgi:formylglycine-generating enzyme required for sulfatase activity
MNIYTQRVVRFLLCLFLLFVNLPVFAQHISVSSFQLLDNDLTANTRSTWEFDQNGEKAALIKIVTTQTGFTFDCGSLGIVKSVQKPGEIWLYVPYGVRHITISHEKLGVMRNYAFPISIDRARTYEMVLTTGEVQTIVKQDLGGAYLVMNVSPAGALVYVDEQEQTVEDGVVTKFLSYGKHTYRVSAVLYQSEAGSIEMGREKKVLDVNLKPAYGQLAISTTPENGARVYIDNSEAGTTPFTTGRLAGGSHTLLLQLSQYESHRMTITVPSDGSTQQLSVPMTPNFGTLSVSSSVGSRIYVNGEDKGASPWTGRLSAGQYVIEARQTSHRSTSQRIDVVRGKEQRIELNAPTPIYGSLNVTSRPVGADVYVDGKKVGTTPDVFTTILEGTRSVELRKQGYSAYTAQVNVTEGKVSDLSATLSVEEKPKPVAHSSGQSGTLRGNTGNAVLDRLISNMVYVEGGTFTMGATSEQGSDAYNDEKPAHSVTLSNYYIGKYEVTQAEWEAVMGSNPSYFKGFDNLPVEKVLWNDCQSFIEKLNAKTGLKFRLPTEAEWEYAARGGNKSQGYKYAGSNNIDDVAWYTSNSSSQTHAVGTKQPNELGLYDMSGNVWEWCSDWYGSYSSSSQTNPTGAYSGSFRVYRGGSWYSSARSCRVSCRYYDIPAGRGDDLGLRLALPVQP